MAIYGTTITVPTITGTHSGYVAQIKTGDLPTAALNSANQVDNGGGNIQIYTDDTKTTRLPIDIVECVTGGSPSFLAYVRMDSASTGADLYFVGDDVQTSQPAVGAPFGRNAVWVDNGALYKLGDLVDSTGNGYTLTSTGSPVFGGTDPFGGTNSVAFGGTSDWLENTSWLNWGSAAAISVWVKTNSLSTTQTVFSQNTSASETGLIWDSLLIRNGVDWEINKGASGTNNGTPATAWKQVHALFTATGGEVFENGVSVGSNTQAYNSATKTTLFLGALARSASKLPLNGSLSLFRVYNATTLSSDYIATEYDNQSSLTWFTNDGWNLESGANAVQITESFPALVESISITATTLIDSTITEVFPSPTEASSVNITLTVTSGITETFPSPMESINIVTGGIVTGQITENFPPLVEATSVNIKSTIVSNVAESFPALVEGINITIPGSVVINGKHILRVNAVTKTVRINAVSKIKRFK